MKITERHRECADFVKSDIHEHLTNPLWEDHVEEIIKKFFPVDVIEENQMLRDWLKETMFFTGNQACYDRQGYSLQVDHNTAIRDVNYRNVPLFETPDEAINYVLDKTRKGEL